MLKKISSKIRTLLSTFITAVHQLAQKNYRLQPLMVHTQEFTVVPCVSWIQKASVSEKMITGVLYTSDQNIKKKKKTTVSETRKIIAGGTSATD